MNVQMQHVDNNELLDHWKLEFCNARQEDNNIIVNAVFKMWDDYDRDEHTGQYVLKPDAVPRCWRVNGRQDYKTLDELVVCLQLSAVNDECIVLDMRDKESHMFINAWRDANYSAQVKAAS